MSMNVCTYKRFMSSLHAGSSWGIASRGELKAVLQTPLPAFPKRTAGPQEHPAIPGSRNIQVRQPHTAPSILFLQVPPTEQPTEENCKLYSNINCPYSVGGLQGHWYVQGCLTPDQTFPPHPASPLSARSIWAQPASPSFTKRPAGPQEHLASSSGHDTRPVVPETSRPRLPS